MSVQRALLFFRHVRSREDLKRRLDELREPEILKQVVGLGQAEGFQFTELDLREAFKQDWAMRWFLYSSPGNSG